MMASDNPCVFCIEIEDKERQLKGLQYYTVQELMMPGVTFSKAMERALCEQEIFMLKNHACYRKTQWYN